MPSSSPCDEISRAFFTHYFFVLCKLFLTKLVPFSLSQPGYPEFMILRACRVSSFLFRVNTAPLPCFNLILTRNPGQAFFPLPPSLLFSEQKRSFLLSFNLQSAAARVPPCHPLRLHYRPFFFFRSPFPPICGFPFQSSHCSRRTNFFLLSPS